VLEVPEALELACELLPPPEEPALLEDDVVLLSKA
jgi:hypothetical protein